MNTDDGYNGADSSIQKKNSADSMPVIKNDDKDVKCTWGKQCIGLTGLQAHQGSSRVIQDHQESLIMNLDEGSYENEIYSTSGEFEESNCESLSSIHFD